VNHSYNPKSLYQSVGNFFIGIGPIILGATLIFIATKLLLPVSGSVAATPLGVDGSSLRQAWSVFVNIFRLSNLSEWTFYLFLYVTLSVGASINLSGADLKGAAKGFVAIVLLLFIVNLTTLWLGGNMFESIQSFCGTFMVTFYGVMIFAVLLNALFACLIPPFLRIQV
jgi:hypothetical protein